MLRTCSSLFVSLNNFVVDTMEEFSRNVERLKECDESKKPKSEFVIIVSEIIMGSSDDIAVGG